MKTKLLLALLLIAATLTAQKKPATILNDTVRLVSFDKSDTLDMVMGDTVKFLSSKPIHISGVSGSTGNWTISNDTIRTTYRARARAFIGDTIYGTASDGSVYKMYFDYTSQFGLVVIGNSGAITFNSNGVNIPSGYYGFSATAANRTNQLQFRTPANVSTFGFSGAAYQEFCISPTGKNVFYADTNQAVFENPIDSIVQKSNLFVTDSLNVWRKGFTLADGDSITLKSGIFGEAKVYAFSTDGNSLTAYGVVLFSSSALIEQAIVTGSANFSNIDEAAKLCLFDSGTALRLKNNYGAPLKVIVQLQYLWPQ
jgi:hypothetical protein